MSVREISKLSGRVSDELTLAHVRQTISKNGQRPRVSAQGYKKAQTQIWNGLMRLHDTPSDIREDIDTRLVFRTDNFQGAEFVFRESKFRYRYFA